MSSSSRSFRSRTKSLPARVKIEKHHEQETKSSSRAPISFRRLADLLKRKRKRGKGDADPLNSLALERQAWYHGKITADFAERYLRRDGHFLVREDPAKPGSCFIVVRYKRSTLHLPLCKVNSSKGTRIRYRIEDAEKSFDSISELINHHVSERKALTPNTSAVITHAVSRDATLLSTDDFKRPPANHNRYVTNTSPANLQPPKPPGTGPLRQRKLEHRKNSDPGISPELSSGDGVQAFVFDSQKQVGSLPVDNLKWTVQAKQREKIPEAFLQKAPKEDTISNGLYETPGEGNQKEEMRKEASGQDDDRFYAVPFEEENADGFYDKPRENETLEMFYDTPAAEESFYDKPSEEKNAETFHDKPTDLEESETFYDKPTGLEESGSFYDKPPERENDTQDVYDMPQDNGNQDCLYDQPTKDSHESLYDKPKNSQESLIYDKPKTSHESLIYDKPKGSQDSLIYDKPPSKPKRMPSFRNSDPTGAVKVDKFATFRPQLVTRCSAPSLRTFAASGSKALPHLDARRSSEPRSNALPEKRHSGAEVLLRQTPSKTDGDESFYSTPPSRSMERPRSRTAGPEASVSPPLDRDQTEGDESFYSTPPSRSLERPSSGTGGQETTLDQDTLYEVPPSASKGFEDGNRTPEVPSKAKEKQEPTCLDPEPPKPMDKQGIFMSVMKKIRGALLEPFLERDCLSLARHMTRVDLSLLWGDTPAPRAWTIEDGTGGAEGLEILTLPQGREIRAEMLTRFTNITNWVATLIVAAGDLGTREKVLTKLIELADVLSDQLGNLVSFMAVMDGLALPQVTRLHHTWSCLHHQHCPVAILYHSTLKPLASLLSSGAPSPFPGVCLPYMVPLMRYMEMTMDDILNDLEHADVDLGLATMLAHLESGRTVTQQLEEFRQEATARLQTEEYTVESNLMEYFQDKLNVGSVLGLEPGPTNRANKLRTLLQWLSENAERSTSVSS